MNEAKNLLPERIARGFWEGELVLVSKMLNADSRNFHGWGYRTFVIEALEDLCDGEKKSMTQLEIDYTSKMIGTNLSNFSAWHSRTKTIQKLLDEKRAPDQERKKVLEQGDKSPHEWSMVTFADISSILLLLQNWNCPTKLLLIRTISHSGFIIRI